MVSPISSPYNYDYLTNPANNPLLNNMNQTANVNGNIPFDKNNVQSLGLRQLMNFTIIPSFTDSDGKTWRLVKSANDSSVEIPDPRYVQVSDYWVHEFPNTSGKVFLYVVEGVKQPRNNGEKPVRVLYQWFSTKGVMTFNPQLITPQEWLRANVFTAPVTDSRLSKLSALCGIEMPSEDTLINSATAAPAEPDIDLESFR